MLQLIYSKTMKGNEKVALFMSNCAAAGDGAGVLLGGGSVTMTAARHILLARACVGELTIYMYSSVSTDRVVYCYRSCRKGYVSRL